jgi:hypothetical protein
MPTVQPGEGMSNRAGELLEHGAWRDTSFAARACVSLPVGRTFAPV